jgi:hypothetical protein
VFSFLVSRPTGRLCDQLGHRKVVVPGALILALSVFLRAGFMTEDASAHGLDKAHDPRLLALLDKLSIDLEIYLDHLDGTKDVGPLPPGLFKPAVPDELKADWDKLSDLVEDPGAGNDDIRDAAVGILDTLHGVFDTTETDANRAYANSRCPVEIETWSADEVAECLDGISTETYAELWSALEQAEKAGTAKPLGGDGSGGTIEEPIVSRGEYASDIVAVWGNLSLDARTDIIKAVKAKFKNEE